jgi:hypothetical protein
MSRDELMKTYYKLVEKEKEIKKAMKDLKPELLKKLAENENEIRTKEFEAKLVNYTSESFKLKDALEKLDRRVLNPFITSFEVNRINIKKV